MSLSKVQNNIQKLEAIILVILTLKILSGSLIILHPLERFLITLSFLIIFLYLPQLVLKSIFCKNNKINLFLSNMFFNIYSFLVVFAIINTFTDYFLLIKLIIALIIAYMMIYIPSYTKFMESKHPFILFSKKNFLFLKKLSFINKVTLLFSLLALLFSIFNIYYSYFHYTSKLSMKLVSISYSKGKEKGKEKGKDQLILKMAFFNSGRTPVEISELKPIFLRYSSKTEWEYYKMKINTFDHLMVSPAEYPKAPLGFKVLPNDIKIVDIIIVNKVNAPPHIKFRNKSILCQLNLVVSAYYFNIYGQVKERNYGLGEVYFNKEKKITMIESTDKIYKIRDGVLYVSPNPNYKSEKILGKIFE